MLKKKLIALLFAILLAVTMASAHKEILITKDLSAVYFIVGKYLISHNEFSNAIPYFKKTIELRPDFAEAYHNLGISYYYSGDAKKAIDFLAESVEIKKDYAKGHYTLALIYYEQKDFDNAISHLSTVTQLEPDNANAHFDLAVAYADRFKKKESSGDIILGDLEDLREALKHYIKADELKPGFSHSSSNAKIIERVISEYE